MKKGLAGLIVALILSGCATPYQNTGLTGGFSETQLQPNVFTVHFRGNGYTSRQRSTDFAMLRCAELALQNGFTHFAIADSSQDKSTMMYNTGSSSHTYGTVNTIGNTSYGSFNTYNSGGTSIPINKPRSAYTIVCFKEKPDANGMVFDAQFLAQSIAKKYGLKLEDGQVQRPEPSTNERKKKRHPITGRMR